MVIEQTRADAAGPATAPPLPTSSPRHVNVAGRRALAGSWIGLQVVVGAAVAAWLPANPSHVIGDVGEVFMMTGAALLGLSILVLLQEATGTGYE